jgi:capsular exopolysaccharide synthesis family protein
MSRIHEALKKAEQERAAGTRTDLPIEGYRHVEEPPRSTATAEVEPPSHMPGEPTMDRSVDFTLESMLSKGVRQNWKPDAKKLLFYNGNSHAPGTEEFRKLRSNLYQLRSKEDLRTILVTSAMPAEGKSFVTANLAQVIARQHERRALTIDADLRLSTLHSSFGAPATPGLTEYLRGQADEMAIIQRGSTDNLFLIPAGASVSNPLELIGNGRLQQLLQKVSPYFDWVLLDSPPVLPVSDSSVMAGMCDGVLLVVRAQSTPFDLVQKAQKQLGDHRMLGVVLNAVEPGDVYGSYYYYSRYYGKPPATKGSLDPKGED